ncbi:MAG: IMP cyclohydrolase [Victivallales bacterium]|nr:IMP cyclohydrolase [Victivallales bacterium]
MYVGRIVAVGMNRAGAVAAMYRVSSRSFPNREARLTGRTVAIMPRSGFESDLSKNPYIAYNCVRLAGDVAVVSNGSHTDPIVEKIAQGMAIRDAFALGLLAMDYEKDSYNTPRIVAAVSRKNTSGWLGIVRHDALLVREFKLQPGAAFYVATYEHNVPEDCRCDVAFDAADAAGACAHVIRGGVFAELEHPVTAAAVMVKDGDFELAVETV